MDFITLTKNDPEFDSYLSGRFSNTHRALPVETYHGETPSERVTFRILPVEKVAAPAWWKVYFRSCRPELLGLTLGPAVVAWLNHHGELNEWDRWPSWFALAGIFFLHTAVFLYNDVTDHMRGSDRLNRRRGSQVIQKGWVSAARMKQWAWVNFAVAAAFGIPAFLSAPFELSTVCALAVASLGLIVSGFGTRWGFSDLALAAVFGPLLTAGIALASFGSFSPSDLLLGLAFGTLTVWTFQMRQFEHLFRSKPEGFHTFLAFWDFDRARVIAAAEAVMLLILQPALAWAVRVPPVFMLVLPLIALPMVFFTARVWRAASPLSSSLMNSHRWAIGSHLSWTLWWVLALGVHWL